MIEARFSVPPKSVVRGATIEYMYSVQQRHNEKQEIAWRYFQIPTDNAEKGTEIQNFIYLFMLVIFCAFCNNNA